MTTLEARLSNLHKHQKEWETKWTEYIANRGKTVDMLRTMRSAHQHDPLTRGSYCNLIGYGSKFNGPAVLFIAKCPRPRDEKAHAALVAYDWHVIRDWTNIHARSNFFFAYLFTSRILQTRKYNAEKKRTENVSDLNDNSLRVHGWYMRALIELLEPRIIVPLGSYVIRATLSGFSASKMSQHAYKNLKESWSTVQRVRIPLARDPDQHKTYRVIALPDPYQTECVQKHSHMDLFPPQTSSSSSTRKRPHQVRGNQYDLAWRQGLVTLRQEITTVDETNDTLRSGDASAVIMAAAAGAVSSETGEPTVETETNDDTPAVLTSRTLCVNDRYRKRTHGGDFVTASSGPLDGHAVESGPDFESLQTNALKGPTLSELWKIRKRKKRVSTLNRKRNSKSVGAVVQSHYRAVRSDDGSVLRLEVDSSSSSSDSESETE